MRSFYSIHKKLERCIESLNCISKNLDDDVSLMLLDQLEDNISKQIEIRMAIDTKLLTVLGVIVGFLTFIQTNVRLFDITNYVIRDYKLCVGIVANIFIIIGLLLLISSIVIMLFAILPKPYKILDISEFTNVSIDIERVGSNNLKKILLKRKQEINDFYIEYNEKKAKWLTRAVVISVIGALLVLTTYFIADNII